MTRTFSESAFTSAFDEVVLAGSWQEESHYYPRYRTRYEAVLRRFAALAPSSPVRVLEVGGGQLAALASRLWDDHVTVADIDETCFATLASQGIETFRFNLARDAAPVGREYDVVLLSEVIEHLPVPGHSAFSRLNAVLRPGGTLVCTTPNLYRLRNVVYLATGRPIFDHFDEPSDEGRGHVLEYSAEHLRWQLERAGFDGVSVELHEFAHTPNRRADRVLSKIGKPLLRVPRFRDNLLATGTAP
ncbi:class I SAM-dependent methyltransferase [Amycolatopsis minnesotensis]|uniref:Class I SAM-dependent methyltransferase n=1 Tax=Amycolatopsis minnesotensis TaxID=337894 RepID=A0ABN2Q771_9PSEU